MGGAVTCTRAPQPSLVVINLSYSPALCCYANVGAVPTASPVRQPRNSLPFWVRRLHSRLLIFRFLPLHRPRPRVLRPQRPGPHPLPATPSFLPFLICSQHGQAEQLRQQRSMNGERPTGRRSKTNS